MNRETAVDYSSFNVEDSAPLSSSFEYSLHCTLYSIFNKFEHREKELRRDCGAVKVAIDMLNYSVLWMMII